MLRVDLEQFADIPSGLGRRSGNGFDGGVGL